MKLILKILIIFTLLLCFMVFIQKQEPFCNCMENFSTKQNKQTLRGKNQQYALTSQINNAKKHIHFKITPIISKVKYYTNVMRARFF